MSDSGTKPKQLKFGILCKGYAFQRWQAECILKLIDNPAIELVILIMEPPKNQKKPILRKLIDYPYKNLLFRFYHRYCFHPLQTEMVSLKEKLKPITVLQCNTVKKGFSEYFDEKDIRKIKNHQPDFLLRFGFGIIRGEILNVAKHGVWSFHHGDEQLYRGGPAGLWEIFNNHPKTGAILQRLTDKLDGGIVLKKGYFKTIHHSYPSNFNQILQYTTHWPLQVCQDILRDVASYLENAPSTTLAPIKKVPRNFKMLLLLWKLLVKKFKFHWNELFQADDWKIGIIDLPIEEVFKRNKENSESLKINLLPNPKAGTYLADPFPIKNDESLLILCEEFSYKNYQGVISIFDINNDRYKKILEKPYHLSYPYIVKDQEKIYCIPENFENETIDLYEFQAGPQELNFVTTLLENVSAVDGTLFYFNNYWWLTFSPKEPANTMLMIYYSEQFTGPYQPHRQNPVKIDISSARPAGKPFIEKGQLFRPAQDCSATYGGSIVLNHVTKLTPHEFEEAMAGQLLPFAHIPYNKGIHTICAAGGQTVVDVKRSIFLFDSFRHQLKRKIFNLTGKK